MKYSCCGFLFLIASFIFLYLGWACQNCMVANPYQFTNLTNLQISSFMNKGDR